MAWQWMHRGGNSSTTSSYSAMDISMWQAPQLRPFKTPATTPPRRARNSSYNSSKSGGTAGVSSPRRDSCAANWTSISDCLRAMVSASPRLTFSRFLRRLIRFPRGGGRLLPLLQQFQQFVLHGGILFAQVFHVYPHGVRLPGAHPPGVQTVLPFTQGLLGQLQLIIHPLRLAVHFLQEGFRLVPGGGRFGGGLGGGGVFGQLGHPLPVGQQLVGRRIHGLHIQQVGQTGQTGRLVHASSQG